MPFRDGWLPVGILLVFVGFAGGEAAISGVGMVILALGGLTRYWSRHLFDRLTLKITASERRAFIGEAVGITVELENKKPLPLPWYQWRVALAEALPAQDETVAAAATPGLKWLVRNGSLGWYQKHDWKFTVHPLERGFHQFGPSRLRSADLLGAFPRLREGDDTQHLIVFPQVFPVEELGLPADRPFGERKGGDRLFEDPLRIAGLRNYRPGDPLRRIDWKATARNGELQSRVYEPSATQQLYIFVNIDTMSHAWEGYLRDDLERTVSVAASLAVWAAGARYAVGLLANGAYPDADRPIRLAPSRSREQLTRILEALAVIQPLTLGDLAGSIQRESGRMPAGSTIVVVASLIPQPLGAAISRLQGEGHHVFVAATSDRALDNLPPGVPVRRVARPFDREVAASP